MAVTLTLTWESSGVTVQDLDTATFQFRGRILAFVVVGCVTIVYAITLTTVGLVGVKVHAKLVCNIHIITRCAQKSQYPSQPVKRRQHFLSAYFYDSHLSLFYVFLYFYFRSYIFSFFPQLTLVSAVVFLLWFFSAPVMSATVTELKISKFARWRDVDVTMLEVATVHCTVWEQKRMQWNLR